MTANNKSIFSHYLDLAKFRITIAVTITTMTGYSMYNGGFSLKMILPALGLFFVACSSSVINQIQEIGKDRLMERTRMRPLPSGIISMLNAWIFAILLFVTGSLILYFSANTISMLLSWLAFAWYNGIYTYLKRVTAFAVVPGSVIGAIPPAVGWTAAGGGLNDTIILSVCFFFFIWQVPHFWLLLMKYGKQYQEAGFPSLTGIYSDIQLKRITFIWSVAMAVSAVLLTFFPVIQSLFAKIAIVLSSVAIVIIFVSLLSGSERKKALKRYFLAINIYMLAIVAVIIIDSYFRT